MGDLAKDNYLKKELYELIKTDESIFDFIQESSLDGLWYWDLENPENEWMNPKFWTVLGYDPKEMPHKSSAWQSIINQDDLKIAIEDVSKHLKNPNYPYDQIVRYTHKNDSTVWIRCRGMAIRDKDGKPVRMLGAHHDITNLKNKEIELNHAKENAEERERQLRTKKQEYGAINEELRQTNEELLKAKEKAEENEGKFRLLIELAPDAFLQGDIVGNIIEANDKAIKMFGYSKEELLSMNICDLFLLDILNAKPLRYDLLKAGEILKIERQIKTKDGKIIHIEMNSRAMPDGTYQSFIRDINERKLAEEELWESEAKLRSIIENSPVGYHIYMLESDSRLVFRMFNPAADTILHVSHEQFIGRDILEAFPALAGTGIPEMYIAVAKGELKTQNFEAPYNYEGINGVYDVRVFKGAPGLAVVNFTDITERKQAEEALLTNEERLSETARIAKVGGWEIDLRNNTLSWTKETFNIYELETNISPDVEGAINYYHPDDRQKVLDAVQQAIDSGIDFDFEARLITARKNQLYVRSIGHVVYKNGKAALVQGMIQDITDRKRAEDEIQLHKSYLSTIIENLPGLLWLKDVQSRFLATNTAFAIACGLNNPALLYGKTDFDIWDSDLAEKYRADDKEVIEQDKQKTVEELISERGDLRWFETFKSTVKNKEGLVIGTAGYSRDITERKRAENELIKAKERAEESEINLQTILSSTNDIIASYDVDIRLLTFNKACSNIYRDLFGIEIYPGLCTLDLFPESMRDFWVTNNKRVLAGETFAIEFSMPTANGEIFFEQYYNPIYIDGEIVCFSTFTRNITERKRMELELIAAKEHAEESDRLKTAFLQNMSHEIRTPMNAIMGFSSLLSENFNDRGKLEKFSKIIDQRCNDLLEIINDILNISKIESGQSTMNMEECNIHELFDQLWLFFQDYKVRINKQEIDLQFNKNTEESMYFFKTDVLKLKQVLINLISNAFKFTEKGSIKCGYRLKNNKLQFYVSDSGIGIPKEKHDYIFERFSQLQHSTLKNLGGTGLGLPIVKGLVKLLGGEVWLESECDTGTTFYFTIDYIKDNSSNKKSPVLSSIQEIITEKTILIVEDDIYNAEYLKEILRNVSSNIITVSNGLSAVNISKEQKIDLILMDIRLPDITGYEATRLILQNKPEMKIIAQTAYAASAEHQKAIGAGCVDYISKPTKQEELLKMMKKYLK